MRVSIEWSKGRNSSKYTRQTFKPLKYPFHAVPPRVGNGQAAADVPRLNKEPNEKRAVLLNSNSMDEERLTNEPEKVALVRGAKTRRRRSRLIIGHEYGVFSRSVVIGCAHGDSTSDLNPRSNCQIRQEFQHF